MSGDDAPQFVYLIILSILIGTGVLRAYQSKISVAFSHIALWAGIFALCFIGVVLFEEKGGFKQALMGSLSPSDAQINGRGEIILHKSNNGHFLVNSTINGVDIRFMIDTGASRVVLSPQAAHDIGINMDDLVYNQRTSTANGQSWAAITKIDSMNIGGVYFNDIPASVIQTKLKESLLGMTFLNKLQRFTIEKQRMIMVP